MPANEWNFLLAASSPDPSQSLLNHIRTLLEQSLDWEDVLRLADRHGTTALLYQNLMPLDVAPPAVLTALRRSYEHNVHKSLFLMRELIRILDCFNSESIEAIPYKGVVLSESYYGDMASRQCGDMDLFVRKRDVLRTKKLAGDLGYTPRVAIPEDAEDDYVATGCEYTFDCAAGKNLLELQWALQPRFCAVDFDMDGLFERAVTVPIAGRLVKTLSPEDLLLVLSLHASKHVWGRLIWLCDIVRIVKREELNWGWIQSQARKLGIERILHITLLQTNQLLNMEIPAPIESAVHADRAALAFSEKISRAVAEGATYGEEQVSYFRLMMRLRERRTDRLRFLLRLTFTPGPGEWATIRLPKALFPLYRLVRLARLASRFARD
ncbi:MAG: nucleotidyltransferase family protein [Candidatus Sulfotelmatobacter sp.]